MTQNYYWLRPDTLTGSRELRRITTESNANGKRTDFYEFYWAHLLSDNSWSHFQAWFKGLIFRPKASVPKDVLGAWRLLRIATWIVIAVALLSAATSFLPSLFGWLPSWLGATINISLFLVVSFWAYFSQKVIVQKFADVARFVDVRPANIAARERIRNKGVSLIKSLIDSERYDRIILVTHSLGTMIGLEVMETLFGEYNTKFNKNDKLSSDSQERRNKDSQEKRNKMEKLLNEFWNGESLDIDKFQQLQNEVFNEAQKNGTPWIISDFITLGSPLTHAEFLLAKEKTELEDKQNKRLIATCPPVLEYYDAVENAGHPKLRFTYVANGDHRDGNVTNPRAPHHAALFAYTRWTNIYSPMTRIYQGDIISGPVGHVFGMLDKNGQRQSGIKDIAVLPSLKTDGGPEKGFKRHTFTHLDYWNMEKSGGTGDAGDVPRHIAELRKAINILDVKSASVNQRAEDDQGAV